MPVRYWSCVATIPLLLALGSCNKQAAYGIPVEPSADPAVQGQDTADPSPKRMKAAQRLLSMVPTRTEGLLLMDFRQVFALMGDMERALGYTRDARRLLAWAQAMADAGPISTPWTIGQLERMGIDPTRPAMVFDERRTVIVLPVKDIVRVKARLATLMEAPPWEAWKEEFVDGLRIQVCGRRYRTVACREEDDYLICARRKRHLMQALKRVPYRSQWVTLNKQDKEALSRAAALFFFSEDGFRGKGMTTVEADGLTVRFQLSFAKLRRLLGPPPEGEPTLLGLAKGARTDFFARLPLGKLMDSIAGLSGALDKVGLDSRKLRAAISGELLFVDHGEDNKALILASTDRALTQKLLDVLVKALPALPSRLGPFKLPAIKATRVSKLQGGGYRLAITSRSEQVKFKWDLGLVAARAGLLVGTKGAAKALLERAPGPVAALRKTLTGEVDRAAYGQGSVLALRSILRDPEEILPLKITWDKVLPGGRARPRIQQMIQAGRFVLDQLDRVSLGVVRRDGDTLHMVGRITTLHRGKSADDQARALWGKALAAKYQADSVRYKTLTARLARRFPRSRFAARLKDPASLDAGGAAAITFLGAVAAPALLKYQLKSRTAEATEALDKIKAGARQYFVSDHWDVKGNLLPKRFPPSISSTPAKPPCGRTTTTSTSRWDSAGWGKLHFAITEPHRYAYSFDSSGINNKAVYTARAFGDLDCDGVYSTYEIRGRIDNEGSVNVVGPIIYNEVE